MWFSIAMLVHQRVPHFQMNPNHCWWHSNVMGGFSHKLRRTMERVRDIVRVRKGGLGRVTSTKGLDMFDDSDLSLYPHEYGHRSIRKASLSVMKTQWFGWSKTSLCYPDFRISYRLFLGLNTGTIFGQKGRIGLLSFHEFPMMFPLLLSHPTYAQPSIRATIPHSAINPFDHLIISSKLPSGYLT